MSRLRKKLASDRPEPLPKTFFVGDRFKLKDGIADIVWRDCKLAGWTIDRSKTWTVTRIDDWCPGGGKRLWVDGPPHMFASRHVQLAWSSDEERRKALGKPAVANERIK